VIGPGVSSTSDRCGGLNVLMAFEGVVFASVTSAIVFAKVARIQSIAPVIFSDPIVGRYGQGCIEQNSQEEGNDELSESFIEENDLPCPILEFRILNTLWRQQDGEIMNATVNLVASRLEVADEADQRLAEIRKQKKNHKKNSKVRSSKAPGVTLAGGVKSLPGTFIQRVNKSVIASAVSLLHAHMPRLSDQKKPYNRAEEERKDREIIQQAVGSELARLEAAAACATVTVDEGANDPALAPKQIFSKLIVETDAHPFFKRIWTIRHVCNENSPLIPLRVRSMIRKNSKFKWVHVCLCFFHTLA
jgi:hypothetical protein